MRSALILIDVQKEYMEDGALPIRNFFPVSENIARLLSWGREGNADIFHVRHISENKNDDCFAPDSPGIQFAPGFEPLDGERAYTKSKPSCFVAAGFAEDIAAGGYDQLILCGFSSFLCCDSTAREAYHRGYNVLFIEDAIGEFSFIGLSEEELHAYACAVMGLEFAQVLKTRNIAP